MWRTGLVAPRHVGSSRTRAGTRVPCIGRWILNHRATREAPFTGFLLLQDKCTLILQNLALVTSFSSSPPRLHMLQALPCPDMSFPLQFPGLASPTHTAPIPISQTLYDAPTASCVALSTTDDTEIVCFPLQGREGSIYLIQHQSPLLAQKSHLNSVCYWH